MVRKSPLDYFEYIMRKSRFFILIAIFSSLLSSVFLFVWSLKHLTFSLFQSVLSEKDLIVMIVSSIDYFLLGVICLIFSWSLYELFIRDPNKKCPENEKIPPALIVDSLDELKEKLSKLVLILLIITFFKYAFHLSYETIYELLAFAIAIFFIALALYFTKEKK